MTVFDSKTVQYMRVRAYTHISPFMCTVRVCLHRIYSFYLSVCTNVHTVERTGSVLRVRACVFIGLSAKRAANLIALQRVSTCDSRYIQTLDQYLDRLSDNDSSVRYGQLLQCVCFPGLCADRLAKSHHPQLLIQKLSAAQSRIGQTDCSQPLAPRHSLCPLTTLTGADRLISQSSLITWNQTLKEGGSQCYS